MVNYFRKEEMMKARFKKSEKSIYILTNSWLLIALIAVFLCPRLSTAASPGITETEIVLGQSCALTGPTKALGLGMRDGALAYFKELNSKGGINGRKIRLVSRDDGYEPAACATNTNQLIDEDRVFLLFGYVGTPTATAAVPIATKKNVPFFAPFTGAEFLRNPLNRYVLNIRASYYQETEAMVDRLIKDKGIKRISVFYQDDAYGKAGLDGTKLALERRGMAIVNEATYPRNTLEVESGVKLMLETKPEAIVMIGAYAPCAQFIRLMREKGSNPMFLNVSFVGSDALAMTLANMGLGVVVTQVVPYPFNKKISVVSDYHKMAKTQVPEAGPGFVGMEGFIAAKALCKILSETPEPITREGFIETAEKQAKVDLGGFSFSFSPGSHQGSNLVYFSQVGPGGFISPVDNLTQLYEFQR